jgi:hypothetical protein
LSRFLDIDSSAWYGLEETSGSAAATHHVGPVCLIVSSLLTFSCIHSQLITCVTFEAVRIKSNIFNNLRVMIDYGVKYLYIDDVYELNQNNK